MGCSSSKSEAASDAVRLEGVIVQTASAVGDPGDPSAEAQQLAALAVASVEAGERQPCEHCGGRFAEQWGSAPWHCFACKKPLHASRAAAEDAAKAAAEAVDAPLLSAGGLTAEGQLRHAARGVSVRFLKQLVDELPPGTTTGEVVGLIVKPRTARTRCRYTELPQMRGHVGTPKSFVSHTWGGAPAASPAHARAPRTAARRRRRPPAPSQRGLRTSWRRSRTCSATTTLCGWTCSRCGSGPVRRAPQPPLLTPSLTTHRPQGSEGRGREGEGEGEGVRERE